MKERGIGGASTLTGLYFESEVDAYKLLALKPGYSVKSDHGKVGKAVFFKERLVARCFRKHDFYRFLEEEGVDWKPIISKKLLPDDAILVVERKTLFIVEVKYQQVAGSVDEKLQTCDFKRKQYIKLCRVANKSRKQRAIKSGKFSLIMKGLERGRVEKDNRKSVL